MQHLLITIPLGGNDLQLSDLQTLVEESNGGETGCAMLGVEIHQPISEDGSITRRYGIGAEYFTIEITGESDDE